MRDPLSPNSERNAVYVRMHQRNSELGSIDLGSNLMEVYKSADRVHWTEAEFKFKPQPCNLTD
jgi:hypothetical protein